MTVPVTPEKFETTQYVVRDHVATIRLNRPERRNALNRRAYDELEAAFRAAQSDPAVRCIVVTGADPAFCSGEDVGETMKTAPDQAAARQAMVRVPPTPAAMAALDCDKPVIAAVNGAAVGWGMELALYADIRLASATAKFAELFVKRGLICDVGGLTRLPAIVGPAKAAELLFTGDVVDAVEALRIGLVSSVHPPAELLPSAYALAGRIAVNPPMALRYMKEGLRRGAQGDPRDVGSWAIETIYKLMRTADHREGVAAFLEKREPQFTGN